MAMDLDTLKEILRKHKLWLNQEAGGEQANLHRADLPGSDLCGTDLSGADLSGANLYGVDLRGANLIKTNLSDADLSYANLRGAVLSGADLSGTDLRGSILFGTALSGTDLRGAKLFGTELRRADLSGANLAETDIFCPMACPDTGSFIGWKKVPGNYIVKLLIPEDAKRSSATGRKCRCSKAKVVAIENINGTPSDIICVHSIYSLNFVYEVGSVVEVDDFDENRFNECAPGIHFFINRQEAVNYGM